MSENKTDGYERKRKRRKKERGRETERRKEERDKERKRDVEEKERPSGMIEIWAVLLKYIFRHGLVSLDLTRAPQCFSGHSPLPPPPRVYSLASKSHHDRFERTRRWYNVYKTATATTGATPHARTTSTASHMSTTAVAAAMAAGDGEKEAWQS